MANDMKQLGDLQDKVLKLLKEAEGMILDNEPLINTLQQSKVTSGMINKRVAEAEEANMIQQGLSSNSPRTGVFSTSFRAFPSGRVKAQLQKSSALPPQRSVTGSV